MDKQSALYFMILVAVVGVGGFMLNHSIQQSDTLDVVDQQPTSLVTDNTSVDTSGVTENTIQKKEQIETPVKKPLEEVKTKKYMKDSDVTKLDIQVTKEGSGVVSKKGDTLAMNYTGMLLDGTVFDSNVLPKFGHVEPFEFGLGAGMVIKGWDEGLVGMKVGEKRTLTIPSDMGYGARGAGALIPPNSALVFEVELLKIK